MYIYVIMNFNAIKHNPQFVEFCNKYDVTVFTPFSLMNGTPCTCIKINNSGSNPLFFISMALVMAPGFNMFRSPVIAVEDIKKRNPRGDPDVSKFMSTAKRETIESLVNL